MASGAHGPNSRGQPSRGASLTESAIPLPCVSSFSSSNVSAKSTADPILRNALRYTVSAREYALLHKYVISRSRLLKRRAPSVATVQNMMGQGRAPKDANAGAEGDAVLGTKDYNVRAVRHAIRVFVATGLAMKAWEGVSATILAKKKDVLSLSQKECPPHPPRTLRLSISLSTILLLYRLLFRFFTRLRAHVLNAPSEPFRRRNPRITSALTSSYAPAIGASLAGLGLGVYPAQQLRMSLAIFALFRALEFGWNCAEDNGMVWGWERVTPTGVGAKAVLRKRQRPWWWGSWMLQPFAFGQLLHAVVFERDCFPLPFGDFIFSHSTAYLHPRPEAYPDHLKWPSTYEIVDNLAQMARLNWPPFISPTLFPGKDDILPARLSATAPLISGAHPLISSLSCATLHPSDPSCTRTFLTFWLRSFPPLARFFLLIYSAMLLPRFRSLYHFPVSTLQRLITSALRISTFLTGSMATAWASICFFQTWLPRTVLPTQRFFIGGLLAGLWAWNERRKGRSVFLYSARASLECLWKVGVKRRWWRAMKGGDVWVFVAALMLTGVVYERDARAIKERNWRKGVSWVRGEAWRDWGAEPDEEDGEDGEEEGVE